jgi:hypothetical protein
MDRLLKIGFTQVGYWTLTTNDEIEYTLNSNHNTRDLLYSFISDGEIKYIGKTTQTLDNRMYGYENPGPTQSTNIRVNGLIKNLLTQDKPVDIFILADNGLLSFGGFRINMAAGLEDTLIKEIDTEWNKAGRTKIKEDKESDDPNLTKAPKTKSTIKTTDSFELKLGQTYLGKGFFNVPVSHSSLLAGDTATIELVLGKEKEITHGYINRRANKTGNPRVMGGIPLRDWFQRTFKKDETVKVTIVSPTSLWLTKE